MLGRGRRAASRCTMGCDPVRIAAANPVADSRRTAGTLLRERANRRDRSVGFVGAASGRASPALVAVRVPSATARGQLRPRPDRFGPCSVRFLHRPEIPPFWLLFVPAFWRKSQFMLWGVTASVLAVRELGGGGPGCRCQANTLGGRTGGASVLEQGVYEYPHAATARDSFVQKPGRALLASWDSRRARRRLPNACWRTKATMKSPRHSGCRGGRCKPTWNACTSGSAYTAASNWRRRSSPPTSPGAGSRLPREAVRYRPDLTRLAEVVGWRLVGKRRPESWSHDDCGWSQNPASVSPIAGGTGPEVLGGGEVWRAAWVVSLVASRAAIRPAWRSDSCCSPPPDSRRTNRRPGRSSAAGFLIGRHRSSAIRQGEKPRRNSGRVFTGREYQPQIGGTDLCASEDGYPVSTACSRPFVLPVRRTEKAVRCTSGVQCSLSRLRSGNSSRFRR